MLYNLIRVDIDEDLVGLWLRRGACQQHFAWIAFGNGAISIKRKDGEREKRCGKQWFRSQ
jgi:hypothetical protein